MKLSTPPARNRRLTIRDLMFLTAISALPIAAVASMFRSVMSGEARLFGCAIALAAPTLLVLSWRVSGLDSGRSEEQPPEQLILFVVLGLLAFTGPVALYFIDPLAGNLVTATQLALLAYMTFREFGTG